MLQIVVPATEMFDESTQTFFEGKEYKLTLEHSLVSVSKWESATHKPFLDERHEKTYDETIFYVKCMTVNSGVPSEVYNRLSAESIEQINDYIDDPMTATTIRSISKHQSREIVTSEIIYHWMISLGIPFECQKWHLNRLLTLIQVCNIRNNPKKMSKAEALKSNRDLNRQRRQALNSSG